MKIERVTANARKSAFEVVLDGAEYEVPWAGLRLKPTAEDPVVDLVADPDFGGEAFTYRLRSGREDTVHADAVLEINEDPAHLQKLFMHRLTVAAARAVKESGLGKRQLARQLGTSPSQLYRLLDPTNHGKSLGQLVALLRHTGLEVDLIVRPRTGRST